MSQEFICFTEYEHCSPVLVCFGPAGCGPSFYRHWATSFGSMTQLLSVQLPGRERRYQEACITDFSSLSIQLADALNKYVKGDFFIFGHSLGGVLGVAVAQAMEQRHARRANTVVVSARVVPDQPRLTDIDPESSDRQLIEFLVSLGCLPPQLAADDEAMKLYLPTIRDDLRLNNNAQKHKFSCINSRLVALAGEKDSLATPAQMTRWSKYTNRSFSLHTCEGGHFFILEQTANVIELLKCIVEGTDKLLPTRSTHEDAC